MDFKEIKNLVLIIGKTEGHIDQSLFARTILDEKNGPPPEINLFNEKNNGQSLLSLIEKDYINLREVTKILDKNSVHHEELGIIIEKEMIINEKTKVTIDELKSYNTNWLTNFMSS